MLDQLIAAFSPLNVLLALGGVAAGTIIGSIPGLTTTIAVAVLVPLTIAMSPEPALILMLPVGLMIGRFAYGAVMRAPKSISSRWSRS